MTLTGSGFLAFAFVTLAAVALGWLVVWSRRALFARVAAVTLAIGAIAVAGVSLVDQLGRPKPVRVEWMQANTDVDVLGSRIVEGQGIYLWIALPGEAAPRAYVLPWDMNVANELQKALEEAAKNGTQARGQIPFEKSWDKREPKFYAMPQPKLPDKPQPEPAVKYEREA